MLSHQFFLQNVIDYHDGLNSPHEVGIHRFDYRRFAPTQEFLIGLILIAIGGYNTLLIQTIFSFQGEIVSRIGLFLGIYIFIKSLSTPLEYKADIMHPPVLNHINLYKFLQYMIFGSILTKISVYLSAIWPSNNKFGSMDNYICIMLFWILFNIARILVGIFINPLFWWRTLFSIFGYGILFFTIFRILIRVEFYYQFEDIPAGLIQKPTLHLPSHRYLFKQFYGTVFKIKFQEKSENLHLKRRYWLVLLLGIGGIFIFFLDYWL